MRPLFEDARGLARHGAIAAAQRHDTPVIFDLADRCAELPRQSRRDRLRYPGDRDARSGRSEPGVSPSMKASSQTIRGRRGSRLPGSQALRAFCVKQGFGSARNCRCDGELVLLAPPQRLEPTARSRLPRAFPLPIKCRGVEMRYAIDAPEPRGDQSRRYSSKSSGPTSSQSVRP